MEFSLRKLELQDAEGMLEWMHDEEVNKVFETPFSTFTYEKVASFITQAQNEMSDSIHRACVDSQNRYLGTVSLKNIDPINKNAEYAISFRSCAHGIGASMYATKEILRIAFEELNLEKIYLYLFEMNHRAEAFYKKCGFVYEATFVRHMVLNGELQNIKWYRMLKEEWKQKF